jgi:hypothetical protein
MVAATKVKEAAEEVPKVVEGAGGGDEGGRTCI